MTKKMIFFSLIFFSLIGEEVFCSDSLIIQVMYGKNVQGNVEVALSETYKNRLVIKQLGKTSQLDIQYIEGAISIDIYDHYQPKKHAFNQSEPNTYVFRNEEIVENIPSRTRLIDQRYNRDIYSCLYFTNTKHVISNSRGPLVFYKSGRHRYLDCQISLTDAPLFLVPDLKISTPSFIGIEFQNIQNKEFNIIFGDINFNENEFVLVTDAQELMIEFFKKIIIEGLQV